MFVDFIQNGQGHGEVGEMLANYRFEPGLMRPYIDSKGRSCVTVADGQEYDKVNNVYRPKYRKELTRNMDGVGLVNNATTLRKDEWIRFDTAVLREARARLRAWADLAEANTYGGFDGMSKTILEHETMSDPGEAVVDMDGLTDARNDYPKFQLQGLPLPITHSDFFFGQRKLAESRNTGTPLDVTMAEVAGRRVAEMIEKTLLGIETGITYGASTKYARAAKVYGYTDYSDINTKTNLTTPTGINPSSTVSDVLAMRETLYNDNFFGPFMLYHSKDWDKWLDNDYYATATAVGITGANQTLRQRLRQIEGIVDVRRLDFFTNTYSLLMVQMTQDVCRAVVGMPLTTVQWPSQGGMRVNFKVMTIMVPQIRSDYTGRCGILYATTS